jgi:hypothetical protein
MAHRRIAVFLGLTAVLLGCASFAGAADPPPVRALFVGNSLTAMNDLPDASPGSLPQPGGASSTRRSPSVASGAQTARRLGIHHRNSFVF